jgi:hypothetical protein
MPVMTLPAAPSPRKSLSCAKKAALHRIRSSSFFVRSSKKRPRAVSSAVYLVLWYLGMAAAALTYYDLVKKDIIGLDEVAATAFGIASFALQFVVYQDIHVLDHPQPEIVDEYRLWIGAPAEEILRFFIMVFLLFGIGKFSDVFATLLPKSVSLARDFLSSFPNFDDALSWIGRQLPTVNLTDDLFKWFKPKDQVTNVSDGLFVIGGIFLFFALFAWNFFALVVRNKPRYQRALRADPHGYHAVQIVINLKLAVFIFLSAVSCLYWILVWGQSDKRAGLAVLLVILYVMAVVALIITRSRRGRHFITELFKSHFVRAAKFSTRSPSPKPQG